MEKYFLHVKPRPKDRNMPTQHIATLLGATVRAFGHPRPVVTCCDVLGVVGSNLTIFRANDTNMSQHIATRWPNVKADKRKKKLLKFKQV